MHCTFVSYHPDWHHIHSRLLCRWIVRGLSQRGEPFYYLSHLVKRCYLHHYFWSKYATPQFFDAVMHNPYTHHPWECSMFLYSCELKCWKVFRRMHKNIFPGSWPLCGPSLPLSSLPSTPPTSPPSWSQGWGKRITVGIKHGGHRGFCFPMALAALLD